MRKFAENTNKQNRNTQMTFYMCGCKDCQLLLKRLDLQAHEYYSVVFMGAPGDAMEFKEKNHLSASIFADPEGKESHAAEITSCPSVILTKDGLRTVYGNGQKIGDMDMKMIARSLN